MHRQNEQKRCISGLVGVRAIGGKAAFIPLVLILLRLLRVYQVFDLRLLRFWGVRFWGGIRLFKGGPDNLYLLELYRVTNPSINPR